MKSTLALLALGLLVSCGKDTKTTKIIENPYNNSANEERFAEIEQRLNALESSVAMNISQIAVNSSSILNLQSSSDSYDSQIAALEAANVTLNSSVSTLQAQMVQLQLEERVVAFIDPCGNGPGYDEVLLKINSGKVVAYFEQGNYRHLSILEVGTAYRTTDQQQCNFKVKADGTLEY